MGNYQARFGGRHGEKQVKLLASCPPDRSSTCLLLPDDY